MWRSRWFSLALLTAVFGALAARAFHTSMEVEVSTAPVTTGAITRRVVATGTLQADTTVDVGSQISGIVESLSVDFNSLVRAGQVVARLDPSSYDAQLREARAALAQAQATFGRTQADVLGFATAVEDARTKLTRAESLAAMQLIPQSDLDAARIALQEANADLAAGEATVDQAKAAVAQAQAVVEQASVTLEHTIIRSPIDGIVIDRNVDVGQTLAASVQAPVLFRIAADLTRMQVQVDVDESDVDGLTPGEAVTFDVESYPGEVFQGTLEQVRLQPIADLTDTTTTIPTASTSATTSAPSTVVTYMAIVEVANPGERLRPGMTAEVVLGGSHREHVVRIPNGALAFRPSAEVLQALGEIEPSVSTVDSATQNESDGTPQSVWEYDGQQFTRVPVRVGLSGDSWSELLRGSIRPGDEIVTKAVLQRRSRN
jgi:HlyD family secretion protein